jgi:DNA polymerase IV
MVPLNELGASLIYFTGNDLFNRRVRSLASSKGMKLNGHGLFRVKDGKTTERIAGETERGVFEVLGTSTRFVECCELMYGLSTGLPWKEPRDRLL